MRAFTPYFIAVLFAGILYIVSDNVHAGVVVNGFGNETSSVSGWSGRTPPPALAYVTVPSGPRGFRPTATLNARGNPAVYAATGPDPNGLQSVNTFAFATKAPLWSITMGGTPFGGDSIAGAGPDLFSLVTPTLYSANVNLSLNPGTIENSTTVMFTGTFQGDAGTAASLSFSHIFDFSSPAPLAILDPTGTGTLQGDGSLLLLGSGSGNSAQTFSFTITDAAAASSTYPNYLENNRQTVSTSRPVFLNRPQSDFLWSVFWPSRAAAGWDKHHDKAITTGGVFVGQKD